jgi:glycosyl transferase family 87
MSTAVGIGPVARFGSVEVAIAWFAAASVLFGAVLWADHSPSIEMTDFSVTYIGARIVHEGRGAKLYDLAEQKQTKASLLTHAQPLIFEHPPFEALLLAPLGGLQYKTAYLIWGLLNAIVWLYLPYLLRPYAPSPHNEIAYLALWLLFPPLGIALYQGQSSLILVLIFALVFVCLKQGREFRAGVWLGLGLFKFQFAIPLAIIFLLRRKWGVISGFTVSAIALGVLSFIAVGWQGIIGYIRLLLNVAGHPHNFSYGKASDMATLQAFCNVILGKVLNPAIIHVIVATATVALIVFAAKQWARADETQTAFDLFFATSIVVALVTGIHMFAHDLSPLALSMFLVLPHLGHRGAGGWTAVTFVCIVLCWIPPLYFLAIAGHSLYLLFPLLSLLALGITQVSEGNNLVFGEK